MPIGWVLTKCQPHSEVTSRGLTADAVKRSQTTVALLAALFGLLWYVTAHEMTLQTPMVSMPLDSALHGLTRVILESLCAEMRR